MADQKQISTRIAVMALVLEEKEAVEAVNGLLHQYGDYIIGRMGIPYYKKSVNLISIALDAPQEIISALSGKLGKIRGVSVKTAYSKY